VRFSARSSDPHLHPHVSSSTTPTRATKKPGRDLPTLRARCRKYWRPNQPKPSEITKPSRRRRQKLRARPSKQTLAESTSHYQKHLAEKVLSKPAKPPDPRARHPGYGPPGSHIAGATLRMDGPGPVSPLKRHTSPLPLIASRVAFPPPPRPRSPHLLLAHSFPPLFLIHPSPESKIYHASFGLFRASWA
jgi:hypothetical protein